VPNRLSLLVAFGLAAGLAGLFGACATEPADLGPPPGWAADGTRWWRDGVDTTGLYRDLETLEAMGVAREPLTYAADQSIAMRGDIGRAQLERAVKNSLIRLYRNQPAVVD